MRNIDIVRRSRAAIGVPFRPQGRDLSTGLDCIGLVMLAYRLPERIDATGYRLSGPRTGEQIETRLERFFRRVAMPPRAGDLLLMRVADYQWHLGVWTGAGLVHADARRRAVVEVPGEPEWAVEAILRRRRKEKA